LAQLGADLLVQKAGDDQCHDLALATGERGVACAERLYIRLLAKASAAEFDGVPDGVHQYVVPNGFVKNPPHPPSWPGPSLHVAVAGDEDDRMSALIDGDAFLEIEAIEVGSSRQVPGSSAH